MGLGKTTTVLTAFRALKKRGKVNSLLVVAPVSVVESDTWNAEASKWSHLRGLKVQTVTGNIKQRDKKMRSGADVFVVTYDALKWITYFYDGPLPDMAALDESSFIKKPNSRRFKCLRFRLLKRFKVVVPMSATPRPNTLLEVWSQIYVVDGGARLGKSYNRFKQRYFRPVDYYERKWEPREGSERKIIKLIADVSIRLEDSDWIKMPRVVPSFYKVRMPKRVQQMYDKFERTMLIDLGDDIEVEAATAASMNGQCHQIANGALYDDEDDRDSFTILHDRKLDALREQLELTEGRNAIIAYHFRHDRERILEAFPKMTLAKRGSMRQIVEDWNRGKIRHLLAHPRNIGHGLNMQYGGNLIILFSISYSYEAYWQLIGRLRRSDNPHDHIDVRHILTRDTIDEIMQGVVEHKEEDQTGFLRRLKRYREQKYGQLSELRA